MPDSAARFVQATGWSGRTAYRPSCSRGGSHISTSIEPCGVVTFSIVFLEISNCFNDVSKTVSEAPVSTRNVDAGECPPIVTGMSNELPPTSKLSITGDGWGSLGAAAAIGARTKSATITTRGNFTANSFR
ncbi:MAG TPA: hypothetical protein VFI31_16495 [Pirellulales bacterium]|nr:hypothetical protein [Pirellulales bacterium]